jgi:hypothetical protein
MNQRKLGEVAIKQLMETNTSESWAEAVCIAVGQLKNKEGKLLRVFLSNDYGEHIERCIQIAKLLRGEK